MTGTVRPSPGDPILARLVSRLRSFESIRMTDDQTMVLLPGIGSVLVDRGGGDLRLELAAESRAELDTLRGRCMAALMAPLADPPQVEWRQAVAVPVFFRG
jgi:hypothetical protein